MQKMKFDYRSYCNMLSMLKEHQYTVADYHNYNLFERVAILRHDIDFDIQRALEFAEIEYNYGVKSTYFVLVTSNLYNIFSKESEKMLLDILGYGHEIGLHFDETRYQYTEFEKEKIKERILQEAGFLGSVIGQDVTTVSMHRPSSWILGSNLQINGMINSYSNVFFNDFKYMSDSRCHWREPVQELIESEEYEKLHILSHPFWYGKEGRNIHESIEQFVNSANKKRYIDLNSNITDLDSIMDRKEIH